MPESAQLLVFVAASAILGITPGPDIIYVITRGGAHAAPVQSAPITSPITSNVYREDGPMTGFTRCKILPVLAALAGAMIAAPGASAAESGAGFFKGKRLTYIVATSPGGGFDFYARLLGHDLRLPLNQLNPGPTGAQGRG